MNNSGTPYIDDSAFDFHSSSVSFDISHLLQEWDFSPGHVISRRFRGRDGKEKIQLRVDLGILQMNTEGRPDGKRPLGYESWYECYKARWEKAKIAQGEDSHGFTLGQEECGKLQQESIQYHHRYICLFQLEDFEGVLRDCDRNLEVFGFVDEFAAGEELGWSLNQFAPQLLMMRTRAAGTKSLKSNRFRETEKTIREGIDALEDFYRNHAREELIDSSGELNSLRNWLNDVRAKKPVSQLEKLQKQLDEAIRKEDYEQAAKVRDQLKKLGGK